MKDKSENKHHDSLDFTCKNTQMRINMTVQSRVCSSKILRSTSMTTETNITETNTTHYIDSSYKKWIVASSLVGR